MACRTVCSNWEPTAEQMEDGMVYLVCFDQEEKDSHVCTVCKKQCH